MALVYVEHRDGSLVRGCLGLLAKAREVASSVVAVLHGDGVASQGEALVAYGADRVYVTEAESFNAAWAPPRVELIVELIKDIKPAVILFENSALVADIVGMLSSRCDLGVNWDLVDLSVTDAGLRGTRLAFGDSVAVEVAWNTIPAIAVFRRGIKESMSENGDGEIISQPLISRHVPASEVVWQGRIDAASADTTLEQAEIVIAGGRGVRDREGFQLLQDLADALGGALAVTMPIVDRGWYAYSHQVGQTGKTIRPRLYLACGVSGAVQHRVGIQGAESVMAINSDPSAPIFGICDVGVIGDLHEIVPRLTALVRDAQIRAANGGLE